jgi:hypothetical protein
VLAHLRNGTTYAQFAAGFGIKTSTVYRYVSEAVDLLAALAPTLEETVRAASTKAYVLLDGTLLPIDRITADRPFHSGKHKKHGMNVQVIADPFSRLLWASPALPGAVHDVRAAREHGIVNALEQARTPCWTDKGHQGARGTVRVPFRGQRETLSAGQQAVNRSHAKIRALVEQAMATLKSWRLLRKLRCSTTRHGTRQSGPDVRPHTAQIRPIGGALIYAAFHLGSRVGELTQLRVGEGVDDELTDRMDVIGHGRHQFGHARVGQHGLVGAPVVRTDLPRHPTAFLKAADDV